MLHKAILAEILEERVPPRAHRRNKRGVKRKMSSFPVRRKADRPPPKIDIAKAIRILPQDPPRAPAQPRPRSNNRSGPEGEPRRENPG